MNWLLRGASVLIAACGSSGMTNSSACQTAADAGRGAGEISGSLTAGAFDVVATSYTIGAPDDRGTLVVYVMDHAVDCCALGRPGWDERIEDRTQVLEMKMIGKTPGDYPVGRRPLAGSGEADVNFTLSSTMGTPSEVIATGGSVTVSTVGAGDAATGSFNLEFTQGALTGTFSSVACPGGHEP